MSTPEVVDNLKQRINLLKQWIECAEAEKAPDKYISPKYKELNEAWAELRKHQPEYKI